MVDRAVRTALGARTVTALVLPNDLQELDYAAPKRAHGTVHSGIGYTAPKVVPYADDLQRAADVLNAGRKVALLVGAGALRATDEVIAVADRLGAGAAKALLGKAALPDDLPWVTGSIGLLGTKPSDELMNECDTLLVVGSGFPYSEFLPKAKARGVQIDLKADMLSLRYPMEVNLVGDSAETLRALLPLLEARRDTGWRDRIATWNTAWHDTLAARAAAKATAGRGVNPQRAFTELSPRLPDDVILTSDSGLRKLVCARPDDAARDDGVAVGRASRRWVPRCPYAIAAKFAYPVRPVIAMVGDGAMQMNNMAELITVAKYWRQWPDPRWICMVLNNEDLNQVTWEQRVMEGDPKFVASQQIPNVPYYRFATLLGLKGIYVDDPEQLGAAWDEALAADRPVVLEVKSDPRCRRCRRT